MGSLQPIPAFDDKRFVAEGDTIAIREAKRLIGKLGGRVEEINTAKIAEYAAANTLGTAVLLDALAIFSLFVVSDRCPRRYLFALRVAMERAMMCVCHSGSTTSTLTALQTREYT